MHELLSVMHAEAKVIQPQALGVLGEVQLRRRLVASYYVAEESITYRKSAGLADGLPWVLEVAFGVLSADYQGCGRTSVVGLNFAPALRSPLPQLDRLLVEHQVRKLVPDERTLATAYRRAVRIAQVQQALDRALAELPADEIQPPPGLAEVIQRRIAGTALPWDQALFELVRQPPTDGDFRVTF